MSTPTPLNPTALTGRTVLVTGASGGVGAATAGALAAADAAVIAHYRTGRDAAAQAVATLPESQRLVLHGDLGTAAGARDLWQAARRWRDRIDVVVVNAAVLPRTPVEGTDEEWDAGWEQALRVNVIGAGALMREAARDLVAQGGGTIIVLSSWAALQGSRIRDLSAYAASKAAIRSLAQTLARGYARAGLRVHVLAPGVIDSGMGITGMDEAARQAVADGLAMGRLIGVEEVAALVAFLATDACPSLTGSTLDINGASYLR